jgi:hypothetical protein
MSTRIPKNAGLFAWSVFAFGLFSIAGAQQDMRINQIRPAIVAPGDTLELVGENLGNPGQSKAVLMRPLVATGANDFINLQEVRWEDNSRVRVLIPETFPAGDYLVKIENDASERRGRSNLQGVRIGAQRLASANSTWPSLVIDRATIRGETLMLLGKHFGLAPGTRFVTIHQPDGESYLEQRLEVLSWNDSRIQARMPAELQPGGYFVLVNDDATCGSNSRSLVISSSREVTLAPSL